MMKFSLTYCRERYPKGVFLNKDLTMEDREKEKNKYIVRKQQKNANNSETIEETNNNTENENHTAPATRDEVHPQGDQEQNIT